MRHPQRREAARLDAGAVHVRVLHLDQGLAGVASAAGDGTVARGVAARPLVGFLARLGDRLGAPVLPERARRGHAGEDALYGAAAGGGPRLREHQALALVGHSPVRAAV